MVQNSRILKIQEEDLTKLEQPSSSKAESLRISGSFRMERTASLGKDRKQKGRKHLQYFLMLNHELLDEVFKEQAGQDANEQFEKRLFAQMRELFTEMTVRFETGGSRRGPGMVQRNGSTIS